jgi:hypothetical protein
LTEIEELTEIKNVVRSLDRKANLMREIHSYCSKKCKFWINITLVLTVILTILIAFLSLTIPWIIPLDENGKNVFGIIIAIAGLAVLFLSISDRIFGLNERYAAHIQGVKLFTDFIRECHQFRHVDIKKNSPQENHSRLESIQNEYSELNHSLPLGDLSNYEFLKCKQDFYIKLKISQELETDPHLDVKTAMRSSNPTTNRKH